MNYIRMHVNEVANTPHHTTYTQQEAQNIYYTQGLFFYTHGFLTQSSLVSVWSPNVVTSQS